MASTSSNAIGSRQASALDASLRLVEELAEAMSGQVQRALRQIERSPTVSLPPRTAEAMATETTELKRECGALRDRLGIDEIPAMSENPPAPQGYVPGTRPGNRADAARTLALELRALGIERDEVANRLVSTFEVEDSEAIVDSVFVEP